MVEDRSKNPIVRWQYACETFTRLEDEDEDNDDAGVR
jgi:hypothetical protein